MENCPSSTLHSTVVVPALSMRLNLGTSSSTNSASVAALVTRRLQ